MAVKNAQQYRQYKERIKWSNFNVFLSDVFMSVWSHCFQFIVDPLIMTLKDSVDELKYILWMNLNIYIAVLTTRPTTKQLYSSVFYECMETLFPIRSPSSDHMTLKNSVTLVF